MKRKTMYHVILYEKDNYLGMRMINHRCDKTPVEAIQSGIAVLKEYGLESMKCIQPPPGVAGERLISEAGDQIEDISENIHILVDMEHYTLCIDERIVNFS